MKLLLPISVLIFASHAFGGELIFSVPQGAKIKYAMTFYGPEHNENIVCGRLARNGLVSRSTEAEIADINFDSGAWVGICYESTDSIKIIMKINRGSYELNLKTASADQFNGSAPVTIQNAELNCHTNQAHKKVCNIVDGADLRLWSDQVSTIDVTKISVK
jgi:hypothetical protein